MPQAEDEPQQQKKYSARGMVSGFIASSAASQIFFPGEVGIVPLVVFFLAWFGYAGSVSESTMNLERDNPYKTPLWVTLLSNVTGITIALAIYFLILLMEGDQLLAGQVGFMGRLGYSGWLLVFSYFAYMAPAFVIAARIRKKDSASAE